MPNGPGARSPGTEAADLVGVSLRRVTMGEMREVENRRAVVRLVPAALRCLSFNGANPRRSAVGAEAQAKRGALSPHKAWGPFHARGRGRQAAHGFKF